MNVHTTYVCRAAVKIATDTPQHKLLQATGTDSKQKI